ncbi:sensor histidine kinase [Parageobacillus thermoglucosidasius]|uniref:sensor histidine kinase n=1 Tax=Parageobacillus thermoglucosidasius TaxID=1426 RepID=UPI000E1B3DBA|nr:sensor histidine kinase [Parageobacillus thermoglucosidasius]RDE27409.1 sensor histidine kinase [Parageobacillus thermoglucosidasius]
MGKSLCKNVAGFAKKYLLSSFHSTILLLYLPIIILCLAMTGWISYHLSSNQIQENAYNNIRDTVFQTKNYLDNRLYDIFEQLVSLSNNSTILSITSRDPFYIEPTDYIQVNKQISQIYSTYNSLLDSIFVNFHNGDFVLLKCDYPIRGVYFSYEEYRRRFTGNREGYHWRNLHRDDIFQVNNNEVVSIFKLIGQRGSDVNGILLFNLRKSFFEKVLSKSLLGKNGYLILVSPDGYMLSKQVEREYQLNNKGLNYLRNIKQKSGKLEFQKPNGKRMVIIYDTLSLNNWKIAAVFPKEEILKNVSYIKYTTVVVIICLIIIASLLANVFSKYATRPISLLVNDMKKFYKDKLGMQSDISTLREINILQKGIQELMKHVDNLMEQIKQEQEKKRKLEFAVMHAQINPHFLYNTLYSIKSLCDMGMNQEAGLMITALSNFFRISISKGQEIISIEEEIEHIRSYLFIQEMRYGDNFSYEIQVDSNILSSQIIKLTLQPLVENAIYHGVKQKREKGFILVKGYHINDTVYFEIIDNGMGMKPDSVKEIMNTLNNKGANKTLGIGLRSVHERIQLHYGTSYGVSIESEFGKGTKVTVAIPMLKI